MIDTYRGWWLLFAILIAVSIYLLSPILTPFVAAALLAYLGTPLVARLIMLGLPRLAAVTLVFVVIFAVLIVIVAITLPLIERQLAALLQSWPQYFDWVQTVAAPWLREHTGIELPPLDIGTLKNAIIQHWEQAGGLMAQLAAAITQSWKMLIGWLFNLVLIPVLTFYLLRDWDALIERVAALLPRTVEPTVERLVRECDAMLAAFLRGQLLVMFCLGVIYSAGLWIAGLQLPLLIGMIAGLLSFVPYLGLVIGVLASAITAVVQTGDASLLLPVAIVFAIGQSLESFVLTPLLVGNRTGLHPVAIIFAVLAGGQLFGIFGVLLAVPAAAVVAVLLRHVHMVYLRSGFYRPGESPDTDQMPPPP
jgi:predicted PurR-regulated permease PerM